MFVLTVIDPNGDIQLVANDIEGVSSILETVNWKTALRVIVTHKEIKAPIEEPIKVEAP